MLQNIDLHALTGWIPERIHFDDETFNADGLFETLYTRLCKGDVLITVATSHMSPEEERRTGLVSLHAYAVLDVQKVNVNYNLSIYICIYTYEYELKINIINY